MSWYIKAQASENGNYGAPQSERFYPSIELPDELLDDYIASGGFVTLELDELGERAQAITVNEEARNAHLEQYPETEAEPTEAEQINLLRAQIEAQSQQLDFYEDCIAEMAAAVYAE